MYESCNKLLTSLDLLLMFLCVYFILKNYIPEKSINVIVLATLCSVYISERKPGRLWIFRKYQPNILFLPDVGHGQ